MIQVKSIKDLQIEKNTLATNVMNLKQNIEVLQKELNVKNADLNMLYLKERNYTGRKKIKVSDHAVVRYFERIKDVDIEAIRQSILPLDIDTKKEYIEDGTYDMGTYKIVLVKNTVVTLYEKDNNE